MDQPLILLQLVEIYLETMMQSFAENTGIENAFYAELDGAMRAIELTCQY